MTVDFPFVVQNVLVAAVGGITLKVVEYLLKRGQDNQQTELALRKELREDIVFLHSRIEALESELEALRTKYWEDVELIYQVKTNNIKLNDKVKAIKQLVVDRACQVDCPIKDAIITGERPSTTNNDE